MIDINFTKVNIVEFNFPDLLNKMASNAELNFQNVTPLTHSQTEITHVNQAVNNFNYQGDQQSIREASLKEQMVHNNRKDPDLSQAESSQEHSLRLNKYNSLIESLGIYLPPDIHSSKDIVSNCKNKVRIPLELMTGIKKRRRAGKTEFSRDLAANAVQDCLRKSKYLPEDIDLIVCCNISRCNAPNHLFFTEPSTAIELKRSFNLTNALAFDINNACAGMFTGIYLVNSLIKSHRIRLGLVVSGEYITHLTDTAQKEIETLKDLRLACLTLGDSGAALLLERSANLSVGFHGIDLRTVSRYSDLCIAKPTCRPHGGATMKTKSQELALTGIYHTIRHTGQYMKRHSWTASKVDHLITHQIAKKMTNLFREEFNKLPDVDKFAQHKSIHNVEEFGNTSTTTHILAMHQAILAHKINNRERTVFSVTASGLTVGTALYEFDDLPERLRQMEATKSLPEKRPHMERLSRSLEIETPVISLESVAVASEEEALNSLNHAVRASRYCLNNSQYNTEDINLLMYVGVYKSDYVDEPSNAALIASALQLNDDSFAFDLYNGILGWLNAVYLVQEQLRAGILEQVLVVASEAENNKKVKGAPLFNLSELGTASILHRTQTNEGFSNFYFETHEQYLQEFRSYFDISTAIPIQYFEQSKSYQTFLLQCLQRTLRTYLKSLNLTLADMDYILGPQISSNFNLALKELLNSMENQAKAGDRLISYDNEGKNLFTSSLPCGFSRLFEQRKKSSNYTKLVLVLAAGTGIQIGCALYHF